MNKEYALRYIKQIPKQYLKYKKITFEMVDKTYKSIALPCVNNKPYIQIAVSNEFLNPDINDVKEFDFVESVIDTYHECYHIKQYTSSDNIYIKEEKESYISRIHNDSIYETYYDKYLYEVTAERYALHKTYEELSRIPELNIEAIMLDYINARMDTPEDAPPYFIQSNTRISDLQMAFNMFDEAYEKALEHKKPFYDYTDDCVGKALHEDNMLYLGFKKAKDGIEQTHFAAIIVLDKYPELYKELGELNKHDYDIEEIKDTFREILPKNKNVQERDLPELEDNDSTDIPQISK